jgi:hypothetical protein
MGRDSKREYLRAIGERYRRASKEEKGLMLREFCAVCSYHRKHAIRLLNGKKRVGKKKSGPSRRYAGDEMILALKRLWLATDQMCSKKLVAAIPLWLPSYEQRYGRLSESTRRQLCQISAATIDRLLKPLRPKYRRKGLHGTKPGSLLKNIIPLKPRYDKVGKPGYLEADTVAHGGDSVEGSFVWSLTPTDVYSGWTENRATWNRGATGVVAQIKAIEQALPFPITAFACDNGSEFLNYNLWRYFTDPAKRQRPVRFSRTRPYHKNDNARVEQKNWTHVRQLLGYDRLDKAELIPLINDLYQTWSLWQNYFCPTFKLIAKIKVNSKYQKTYHSPQTPCRRLLDYTDLAGTEKQRLQNTFRTLNPFQLKKRIDQQLKEIFLLLR